MEEFFLSGFCDTFDLKSLKKTRNLLQKSRNPKDIDLILINNPRSFQNSCMIETGSSNFHGMVVTDMKTSFGRLEMLVFRKILHTYLMDGPLKPRVTNYRDYKSFGNKIFWEELLYELWSNIWGKYNWFWRVYWHMMETLNHHAPTKQKYIRGNHLPFMNKTLSKEIMHRASLAISILK